MTFGVSAWATIAPVDGGLPGIAVMIAVLSFNVVGDAVRDVLDPRLRDG